MTYSVWVASRLVLSASASVCSLSTNARPPYSSLCRSGDGLDGIVDWICCRRVPKRVDTGMEPRSNESEEELGLEEREELRWPGGTLILRVMVSGGGVGAMMAVLADLQLMEDSCGQHGEHGK